MKFTFEEWKFIQHCIECAGREFEKMMLDSTPSDKETSCYQIFKRQTEKANALVEKIPGAAKTKQSSRKYVCPMCGCIIRATKEVHVICGDCNVEFEEEA